MYFPFLDLIQDEEKYISSGVNALLARVRIYWQYTLWRGKPPSSKKKKKGCHMYGIKLHLMLWLQS